MSDSGRPHRRQPTRLPRPWDSPGKNTGVGCHCLLRLHIIASSIFSFMSGKSPTAFHIFQYLSSALFLMVHRILLWVCIAPFTSLTSCLLLGLCTIFIITHNDMVINSLFPPGWTPSRWCAGNDVSVLKFQKNSCCKRLSQKGSDHLQWMWQPVILFKVFLSRASLQPIGSVGPIWLFVFWKLKELKCTEVTKGTSR